MSESTLAAVAEAAAGQTNTPAPASAATATPTLAPAIAAAAQPTPAEMVATARAEQAAEGCSLAYGLGILAAAYPQAAATLNPLAELAEQGVDEKGFAKAVVAGAAGAPQLALNNQAPDNAIAQPNASKAEAVEVDTAAIYASRAKAMGR